MLEIIVGFVVGSIILSVLRSIVGFFLGNDDGYAKQPTFDETMELFFKLSKDSGFGFNPDEIIKRETDRRNEEEIN